MPEPPQLERRYTLIDALSEIFRTAPEQDGNLVEDWSPGDDDEG